MRRSSPCEGAHLEKDCPLTEDEKNVEEVKYGDGRPFQTNNNRYRMGTQGFNSRFINRPPYGERRPTLEETISKFLEESAKRETEREHWLKSFQEGTQANLKSHDETLKNLEEKIELLSKDVQEQIILEKAKVCVWYQ